MVEYLVDNVLITAISRVLRGSYLWILFPASAPQRQVAGILLQVVRLTLKNNAVCLLELHVDRETL
jgi:hypothetical protein